MYHNFFNHLSMEGCCVKWVPHASEHGVSPGICIQHICGSAALELQVLSVSHPKRRQCLEAFPMFDRGRM